MNIRKIAVVGSFAAGAALAFAPTAAADTATDIFNTTVDTEISSLNSIFVTEVDFGGVSIPAGTPMTNSFDTIPLADAPNTAPFTPLDYELYGVNPAVNASSDPGAYSVFNGALTEFYDAYNSDLYGLLNNGALIPTTDLFGSSSEITTALATGTDLGAATDFFNAGIADLAGFFGIPSLF